MAGAWNVRIRMTTMKIGFSSLVCPGWSLDNIIVRAGELGFDGVELRGLRGEFHLPLVPELSARPEAVRQRFDDANIEIVCLGCSATLDSRSRKGLAESKASIIEFIELAAGLGVPFVRIFAGEVQRWDHRRKALTRITQAVGSLVPTLSRMKVTLLVENSGDFSDSEAMWFLADAIDHPSVKICWNQANALTAMERPTNSIPRLGSKIGMMHVCDAKSDERGIMSGYCAPGEGDAELSRQLLLLRGIAFGGYLMFEWPKAFVTSLPAPDAILPKVAAFLRERLDHKQAILTAYKGDKRAPRLPSLAPAKETASTK